jgi:hypothetical protein
LPVASTVAAVAAAAALLLGTSDGADVVLTLKDPALTESSGLAVSGRHPDILWTHNDGGSVAQVVAIDSRGRSAATVTLQDIDPYDPEALAPGPAASRRPELYLGDIGDNQRSRPDVSVFRFAEPKTLQDTTVRPRWYRFTYPDGPHDAEALLVGPDGRIMIATKAFSGARLYRAPKRLVTDDQGTNLLTAVARVPALVTDGAYLPDGRFVLRTYSSVHVYDRPGHEVASADLPLQPQGESVAADGQRLLVGSEGVHSEVLAVPVPGGASTESPTASSGRPSASPSVGAEGGQVGRMAGDWWLVAGIVLLAGMLLALLRRRRRR